jgi:tetratricopeptide (TPR) repeat protein
MGMADIFVSYTSNDREWALWIAQELEALGHTSRVHEWEISAGGDIPKWMEESLEQADHCVLVVSKTYLTQPYSSWERRAAQWATASKRPNFALPVFIEVGEPPILLAHLKRCTLHGLSEEDARTTLTEFLKPAQRPPAPLRFPGSSVTASNARASAAPVAFPGRAFALSNIPIRVPRHFLGRDDALAAIEAAFERDEGRVAITALHGLRGVGKTTLAAAYAEHHRANYRATWWIRAQTEAGLRADLVALGIRLNWVGPDDKDDPAVEAVMERLRHEGESMLLIFDNAVDANAIRPYLPLGGGARVLVTSNAHAWRGVAVPIEIRVWPKEIGADYLIARTGREAERTAAEGLSEVFDGLPLAHEQAAAYCEELEISFADYRKRYEDAPARFLDDARRAPAKYGRSVWKTFTLAIEEAAKKHPAAERLIVHAALLAPEPIPLFLFAEAREKFGEPLTSMLAGDGLDEAVAALRVFALVGREVIVDERDASIRTDAILLHRLVREVAAARRVGEVRDQWLRTLVAALAAVYPNNVYGNPPTWARCAPLTPHVLAICENEMTDGAASAQCAKLLGEAGSYFHGRGAYLRARPPFERALAICERVLGPEHPNTGGTLNDLALLLKDQGDLVGARPLYERALAIYEKVLGPEHPNTALSLNNLASLLTDRGDLVGARPLFERALAINEKVLGPEHSETARTLNNLASLLKDQGDSVGARQLFERALAINKKGLGPEHPLTAATLNNLALLLEDQGDLERALAINEKVLGPEHPRTAASLNNLAFLLKGQGNLAGARPLFERTLAIYEKVLGPEHPDTAASLNKLALLLQDQGDLVGARPLFERTLAIYEKLLGPEHPDTAESLNNLASLLQDQGDLVGALPLLERALAIREKVLGPEHPHTAASLNNLALPLQDQGDLVSALPLYERALAICERVLGPEHPNTALSLNNLALLFKDQGDLVRALPLLERALAIREKVLGPEHPDTAESLNNLATLLKDQGDLVRALPLLECALAIREKVLGPEHPHTAESLNNLAFLLKEQGDLVKARPLYERALAINEKVLGPAHPYTALSLNNLAGLLEDQGDLGAALPLYERALAINEKVFGPEHPGTNRVRADVLRARRRRDEGERSM